MYSFLSKSVKWLAGISYTLRFLVEVHCPFARAFNEHPNNLSLRTLICNTFIEGHPNFLQNIFLSCWNDLPPFYRHNSSCTVFYILGRKKRFKIAIMFSGRRRRSRELRKEWICESRCRQVSVRLHVFAGFSCP